MATYVSEQRLELARLRPAAPAGPPRPPGRGLWQAELWPQQAPHAHRSRRMGVARPRRDVHLWRLYTEDRADATDCGQDIGSVYRNTVNHRRLGRRKGRGVERVQQFARREGHRQTVVALFDPPKEPIPAYRQNQFGFAVGGPIVRDRTHVFGNY